MIMEIHLNKVKFSPDRNFVLYDFKDSPDNNHFHDVECLIYFFIKDKNPEKLLGDLFINPMKAFKFSEGLEPKERYNGNVPGTNFNYLFAGYELPRIPILNWAKYDFPIRRDTRLSDLTKESDAMKYLSKYIDNN